MSNLPNLPRAIAVDFDGTLFVTEYPVILYPKQDIIDKCIALRNTGYKLTLWTCRCGDYLEDAIKACRDAGLEFDYINANSDERSLAFGGDSRKVSADYYIDDCSLSFDEFLRL